ncbi:MAG TPA: plasmid pRiA4b ORF-3 family protein [Vicinamibacterales bacterium]|nr:plasmid pRiA4b ORF-3 family protein [Vicinamibacterales bacterium]
MTAPDRAEAANRYCDRLHIPVPDLDVAVRYPTLSVADLMALAVLEAGRPLAVDEIAARLARLDLPTRLRRAGDPAALPKAWRGQGPLVRDPVNGLFYLDLLSHYEIGHLAFVGNAERQAAVMREPPQVSQPPDTVPLSQEEVDTAFEGRDLGPFSSVSSLRQAAAILEAAGGGPLSLDEVNDRLTRFSQFARLDERAVKAWRTNLVRVEDDGSLRLERSSPDLPGMRRDIRRLAVSTLRERAWSAGFQSKEAELDIEREARDRRDMEEARRTRRAFLHVVVLDRIARAAAVIDVARRELRSFIGSALREVPAHLEGYDFLAGLDLRPSLRALGLDPDRWWLAELRPSQRTFRPAGTGRALPVELRSIVQATTNRRGAPANPKEWKSLLTGRSPARLEARLARDADALFALYEYGSLHGGVRMRRRQGEALLPVSWSMRGDFDFWSVVEASIRRLVPVHLVVGYPAGLSPEPYKDAVPVTIVEREMNGRTLYVRAGEDGVIAMDRADVAAIGLPATATAAIESLRPAHSHRGESRTCRLLVTLHGISPPIWRRLQVEASMTLEKLHDVIQAAFGWTDSHLHAFLAGDERIGIPHDLDDIATGLVTRSGRLVRLADLVDLGFTRFAYEYDFGDSWMHTIEVEEVRPGREEGDAWARCLEGARACPPEDCGGVRGYEQLLEILFDPRHPEFEQTRRWAARFEPERFELREAKRGDRRPEAVLKSRRRTGPS